MRVWAGEGGELGEGWSGCQSPHSLRKAVR